MKSRFWSIRSAVPGILVRSGCLVALVAALSAPARGQCTGDCNGDNSVAINEIILGVNIALASETVSACPEFDTDTNDSVDIDELVAGVGSSIEGCGEAATPTPTATVTPTVTPTPTISELCGNGDTDSGEQCDDGSQCEDRTTDCTSDDSVCAGIGQGTCAPRDADGCQANCRNSVCGDRIVDNLIEDPETCDDGNTTEGPGDTCPASCRIARCDEVEETFTANVDFDATPNDLLIGGLELFVRYPDGVVEIPGRDNAASVLARITSNVFSVQPNDIDFAVNALCIDQSFAGVTEGTAFTIEFDRCVGSPAPSAGDFDCVVKSASDPNLSDVTDQVSCSVVLP